MSGQNDSGSGGAPKWMTTFADLSTLLMTFFVLLLSFSNMDLQKFRDMLGSVRNAFGVQTLERGEFQAALEKVKKKEEKPVTVTQAEVKPAIRTTEEAAPASQVAQESAQMAAQVEEMVKETGLGEQVQVMGGKRGVRIRVKGGLLFEPGAAQLRTQAGEFLNGIAKVLNKSKFFLLIEGHTDNIPISTDKFPSNWELSSARASAVVRYLTEKAGINPVRMAAIGLGPNFPIASNEDAEGRAQNRRVEFIFTRYSPRVAVQ